MKKLIKPLIFVFVLSSTSAFAQSSYTSSYNSKKTVNSKNKLALASNDAEYEYEDTRVKNRTNDNSEYEYEDGTIENRIKITSTKKKTRSKPEKKYINISEKKKLAYGFKAPSEFFDLSDWSLSVPGDRDGNNRADNIEEKELSSGYFSDYFYATNSGAMVFTCPIGGYKTSVNTNYTRVELREMLRAGNTSIKTKGLSKNNWVLRSSRSVKNVGAYDGKLKATLAINHVTTTGNSSQVGRVIIGQIHAKHDEPLRLYYRKLPDNKKGSIYFAHEGKEKEIYYDLIGSRKNEINNPVNGIELNEKFSYDVSLLGNELTVKIYRKHKPVVKKIINIKRSGYKDKNEYMYFKAGVYNQNKTGNPEDYVQATFYELKNSHPVR